MIPYDALSHFYDSIFHESYYRDYERFVLGTTGLRGGRVLDLACGTGRLGARLRRRGFQVTGVDRSPGMLERARCRGLKVVRSSIESFRHPPAFDLALCTFDSLNHLPRLDRAFRAAASALAPGGRFVFDLNTPHKINVLCPAFRARHFRTGRFEVFWLSESAPDLWTSRIVIFESVRGRLLRFEETLRERCFSQPRVDSWLAAAGFETMEICSDLRRRAVTPTSERWHYVVRKNGPGNPREDRPRSRRQ
jgi:SAM-dependent methyltransferase